MFAQSHRLLAAQRAELVVVFRAKRGLAVAHKVEGSHAADCDQNQLQAFVAKATDAIKCVAFSVESARASVRQNVAEHGRIHVAARQRQAHLQTL